MKTEEIPHLILHVNSLTEIVSTNIKEKKSWAIPVESDLPPNQRKEDTVRKSCTKQPQNRSLTSLKKPTGFPALHSCVERSSSLWKALSFGSKDQTAKLHKIMSTMSSALIYLNGKLCSTEFHRVLTHNDIWAWCGYLKGSLFFLGREKFISVLSQLFTKTPGDSHQQLVKLPSLQVKAKDAYQLFVYKYSAIIQIPRHPVALSSHGNLLLPYLKLKLKVMFDWSKVWHF